MFFLPSGSTSRATLRASEVAMSVFAAVTARMMQLGFEMCFKIRSLIWTSMSLGWSPTGTWWEQFQLRTEAQSVAEWFFSHCRRGISQVNVFKQRGGNNEAGNKACTLAGPDHKLSGIRNELLISCSPRMLNAPKHWSGTTEQSYKGFIISPEARDDQSVGEAGSEAHVTLVIPGRSTRVRFTTWGENIFRWMGSSLIPCRGAREDSCCVFICLVLK